MKKIIICAIAMFAIGCNETNNNNSTNNNTNNQEICFNNVDDDLDGAIDCNDSDCRFNGACTATDCGNGLIDADEECDGADLNGQSCEGLNLGTGTLTCIECAYNTTSCHQDPLKIYQSGARIKMRVGRAPSPDGSIDFKGWFDTTLGINCVFRKHTDGSYRCLPELKANLVYSDEGCTNRIAGFMPDDDLYPNGTMLSMEVKTGKFVAYTVIGMYSGAAYVRGNSGCEALGSRLNYMINENPSSSFQEQLESIE